MRLLTLALFSITLISPVIGRDDRECGKNIGKCPSDECGSQYGYLRYWG